MTPEWLLDSSLMLQVEQMMSVMQPLGKYTYTLSLDYELAKWDLH